MRKYKICFIIVNIWKLLTLLWYTWGTLPCWYKVYEEVASYLFNTWYNRQCPTLDSSMQPICQASNYKGWRQITKLIFISKCPFTKVNVLFTKGSVVIWNVLCLDLYIKLICYYMIFSYKNLYYIFREAYQNALDRFSFHVFKKLLMTTTYYVWH